MVLASQGEPAIDSCITIKTRTNLLIPFFSFLKTENFITLPPGPEGVETA